MKLNLLFCWWTLGCSFLLLMFFYSLRARRETREARGMSELKDQRSDAAAIRCLWHRSTSCQVSSSLLLTYVWYLHYCRVLRESVELQDWWAPKERWYSPLLSLIQSRSDTCYISFWVGRSLLIWCLHIWIILILFSCRVPEVLMEIQVLRVSQGQL